MSNTNTAADRRVDLRVLLDHAGVADKLVWLVDSQLRNLQRTEEELLECASRVERNVALMRSNLAAGRSVNALGELQSTGSTLDRLCAEREQQRDALRQLLSALTDDAEQRKTWVDWALGQ